MVKEFGLEPLRYFMLSQIPIDSDGDFTFERFKEVYNADLANGLGNLVARVAKLGEQNKIAAPEVTNLTIVQNVTELLEQFKFNEALSCIWQQITEVDKKINEEKPWELEGEKLKRILENYVVKIQQIAVNLQPFLPETSEKILTQFSGKVKSAKPLFPRI